MFTVPKLLHRIWLGSFLPQNYQINLSKLKETNSDYEIWLWVDFDVLSKEEIEQTKAFSDLNQIQLKLIRDYPELTNSDLIYQELALSKIDQLNRQVHYVRASDIARVAILFEWGGVYTDTDTKALSALPELNIPHGFCSKIPLWERAELISDKSVEKGIKNPKQVNTILYDFLAAVPKNKIIQLASEITRLDYKTYANSNNKSWEQSNSKEVHLYTTVKLTGTSIKTAINFLIVARQYSSPVQELFLDADPFFFSSYDKSWLANHQDIILLDEEEASYNLFLQEIEEKREAYLSQLLRTYIPFSNFTNLNYPKQTPDSFSQNNQDKIVGDLLSLPLPKREFNFDYLESKLLFQKQEFKIDLPIFVLKTPNKKLSKLIQDLETESRGCTFFKERKLNKIDALKYVEMELSKGRSFKEIIPEAKKTYSQAIQGLFSKRVKILFNEMEKDSVVKEASSSTTNISMMV